MAEAKRSFLEANCNAKVALPCFSIPYAMRGSTPPVLPTPFAHHNLYVLQFLAYLSSTYGPLDHMELADLHAQAAAQELYV